MFQELKALRKKIKAQIQIFEKDLIEARNSAALGGNSRAFLLHLERKVHGSRKELASLEAQMASAFVKRSPPAGDNAPSRADAPYAAHSEAKTGQAASLRGAPFSSQSRNRRRHAEP